jgi:hypothetical protein
MVLNRLKTSIKVIGSDHIKQLSRYFNYLQSEVIHAINLREQTPRQAEYLFSILTRKYMSGQAGAAKLGTAPAYFAH